MAKDPKDFKLVFFLKILFRRLPVLNRGWNTKNDAKEFRQAAHLEVSVEDRADLRWKPPGAPGQPLVTSLKFIFFSLGFAGTSVLPAAERPSRNAGRRRPS